MTLQTLTQQEIEVFTPTAHFTLNLHPERCTPCLPILPAISSSAAEQ